MLYEGEYKNLWSMRVNGWYTRYENYTTLRQIMRTSSNRRRDGEKTRRSETSDGETSRCTCRRTWWYVRERTKVEKTVPLRGKLVEVQTEVEQYRCHRNETWVSGVTRIERTDWGCPKKSKTPDSDLFSFTSVSVESPSSSQRRPSRDRTTVGVDLRTSLIHTK